MSEQPPPSSSSTSRHPAANLRSNQPEQPSQSPLVPTLQDVLTVRSWLSSGFLTALPPPPPSSSTNLAKQRNPSLPPLPTELVDLILNYAEYWPCLTRGHTETEVDHQHNANFAFLTTEGIWGRRKFVRKVKRVEVRVDSHDQ
ncbi:hypothetical protein HK102_007453, partial [Quaeritorhiza haematococci]